MITAAVAAAVKEDGPRQARREVEILKPTADISESVTGKKARKCGGIWAHAKWMGCGNKKMLQYLEFFGRPPKSLPRPRQIPGSALQSAATEGS